ncbi:DNA helicase UvrD [Rhodoferax koreense]|uniref:DNA 3'-5' helicase n=1 Tax=Rhodoferax koreensis TaxID=1842727 RepID=A0A1P8JXB3_9BURK|nr:UvrD-helicase domain-containing protein [Rhodoferax koreense]APW38390.1 DNA helicase UvrD [Rhodoferax koreense]
MSSPAYEHNGRPVRREAFYAIACDPRRSVAVEACAGAGKTWMLVSRILRALVEPREGRDAAAAPHEILAITFTKKAAGEMRQRLNEWLVEFAAAEPAHLVAELVARGVSPEAAPARAAALQGLHAALLAHGRPVQIRTFHSWFAALLRTAPLAVLDELGLPANYELLEDDSEAVRLVWRRFYTALVAKPDARADFDALVAEHGRFQAQKALASALQKRVEFALADAQGVVDASVLPFDVQFPEFAGLEAPEHACWRGAGRVLLLEAASCLGKASAKTFAAKGDELVMALTAGDIGGVMAALLTATGGARKFGDKIVGIENIRAAQELVLRVAEAQLQQAAWTHQQRMARLTRLLVAEFAALKRAQGWIDMNDVERAASRMLSDEVLSGWVQERLDARVQHLLIDEFQDTSPLQWQSLHAWLSGYVGAGSAAPSVFIVGDPKQSIYRFRRAEPQVFRAAQAFVREGLDGDLLSCDHTRRNAPAVIDAVNAAMGEAQAAGAYDGFRHHTTESTMQGAVLQLPAIEREAAATAALPEDAEGGWRDSLTTPREEPEETLRSLECRQAAAWLAQQIAHGDSDGGLQPKDVMVLARKRDRLAVMQDVLRSLSIPTQQPEKADLAEAPEVQDVVALLDALVSPAHDLSLARALKSPLFGVPDDALVELALLQRAARHLSWFDLLQIQEQLPQSLIAPGPVLMRWKRWIDSLPPHDALDAIYADGDVLARFAAAAPPALRGMVLANLRALLGTALQLDGARYATPYGLVRALKAGGVKAPVSADVNAVRLLTVHGAKGLEARLVLLLDTDAAASKAETMGVLVEWPGEAAAPERLVFLASETRPPACTVAAVRTEQAARQREELNAMYVAMTRARQMLAISSVQPRHAVEGSWWQRLAPLSDAVPVSEEAIEVDAVAEPASDFVLQVLPALSQQLQQPPLTVASIPAKAESSPGDAASSAIGQAMHRLLEWARPGVPEVSPHHLSAVMREFAIDARQAEQAAAMVAAIRAGEGAWAWDAALIAWQGNEVALNHQGQSLRLDRLVQRRDSGEWWVLDYKSALQPQRQVELVEQLRRYRTAVLALTDGAPVRAAFLAVNGAVVEVV